MLSLWLVSTLGHVAVQLKLDPSPATITLFKQSNTPAEIGSNKFTVLHNFPKHTHHSLLHEMNQLSNPDKWREQGMERDEGHDGRDKGEKTAEWLMDGGCITNERRKTDRARPTLEAQQSDKQRRRHKSERRVMKTSTQEREEMLDCLHLLSLARWPSGRQDDGHMNQTLSAWKRVEDENAACQSSLTWPALFHQRKDEESHKEEDAKTYSWPKMKNHKEMTEEGSKRRAMKGIGAKREEEGDYTQQHTADMFFRSSHLCCSAKCREIKTDGT